MWVQPSGVISASFFSAVLFDCRDFFGVRCGDRSFASPSGFLGVQPIGLGVGGVLGVLLVGLGIGHQPIPKPPDHDRHDHKKNHHESMSRHNHVVNLIVSNQRRNSLFRV